MEVDLCAGEGRVGVPETGRAAEVGEAGVDAYAGACCDEEGVGLIEQSGSTIDWRFAGKGLAHRCCCANVHGLARSKKPAIVPMAGFLADFGAGEMNRTPDLLITNELLYRLSYTG